MDNKKGYASCEWVGKNGESLWWVTRDNKTGLSYFDTNIFPYELKPCNRFDENKEYSEIRIYDSETKGSPLGEDKGYELLSQEIADKIRPNKWNDVAFDFLKKYKNDIEPSILCFLFHEKMLRQIPNSTLELPKPRWWKVTAFLPQNEDPIFAVISNKWSKDNPEWITFHCGDINYFIERLSNFEVFGWMPNKDTFYNLLQDEVELERFNNELEK